MSASDNDSAPAPRHRTASRMRFVAPPGMEVDVEPRQTIGRYEIIKTLGKGAMGVVYKARDPLLDRIVAVKTIVSPRGVGRRVRDAYIERFEREAKAAAKMQHPAIVTIFDVGVDDHGAPFMVLEYLPGESLADRLDRVRMPLGRGVQIGLDLANALAFAHRQRIVHRDVKPANVLHAGENRWKLADFGIARLPDSDLTQVGIFMGTPGYSPPEAIRQGRYTAQADVFAWGAVLYEILSGRIPYEGPDTRTTNGYVIKATAPSPREYDASIPEPICEVIMTALDPSAASRYKDGAEAEGGLRKAWEHCLTSSMIAPLSLTGDEIPHERAGAEMHHLLTPRGTPASPPAPHEVEVVKAKANQEARGEAEGPMLVIESRTRVSDDAPTQLLIRESSQDEVGNETVLDLEPAGAAGDETAEQPTDEIEPEPAAAAVAEPAAAEGDGARSPTRSTTEKRSRAGLFLVVILLALGAGAGAAYLIMGL